MHPTRFSRAAAGAFLVLSAARLFANSIDVVFYDNRFGSVDDTTGAYTQISTLPIGQAGGIAVMNNLIYLEDFGNNLFTVDPITGTAQLVGNTGLGLSMGAFAGGALGLFEVDGASNLFSISAATGKAAEIGATGLVANNGAFDTSLSMSGSTLYYTAGRAGQAEELYSLNITAGAATDLGSTGVTGIAGSAVVSGELELYQYGQSVNYLYSAPVGELDSSTQFSRGAVLGAQIIDGGATYSPTNPASGSSSTIPEPAALTLMSIGIIGLGLARRKWKANATGHLASTVAR